MTIECAENPVGGGLVSSAEWKGVVLGALLERAKPLPTARFVRLSGADGYTRSIPFPRAEHRDSLLAHRMNGENLWVSHGGPLRALIPGWYGMDSVKWLREIQVVPEAANSTYLRRTRVGDPEPVTAMQVKAAFARPMDGAILFPRTFILRGAAWAGENRVRQVEVSMDAGASWQSVRLLDVARPYAWVRWEREWRIPEPGAYELVVRATDDAGRTQPAQRDPARVDEYEQNAYQRVRVVVT